MKKNATALLIVLLLALSCVIYLLQLMQFHAPRDTFFYLMQDLAFLPIQIALVTVALGKLISAREKRARLNKTNMMVSTFFSEIGTDLISRMTACGTIADELRPYLDVNEHWSPRDFRSAEAAMRGRQVHVACTVQNLAEIKAALTEKRMFLLVMLGNPTLLEHEAFTDMLWAILHLTDELLARDRLEALPAHDLEHLSNDIKRALAAILLHWIGYMRYIKVDYPYLFSLETRRNPFGSAAGIVIR